MTSSIVLNATLRTDVGKGASRRLRRDNGVPAILYGAKKEAQSLLLQHHEIIKALENEAIFTQLFDLNIDGEHNQVRLRDIQRHAYKPKILHMDFQRITGNERLHVRVPLHFINEADSPAVKNMAIIAHQIKEVEIICPAMHIPAFIEVDLSNLEVDQILHLSDLKLPADAVITALTHGESHDLPVVAAHMPRAVVEEEPAATEEASAAAPEGDEGAAENKEE
ncbi:MAG: 50S ribosomal protein L25/general stress protein Ctc [Gammaproteobacteria bacterium]|nr:50S ribosomal protein L25/general stress protein Ctc [Gammaproteobacteria bacterium]